MSSVTERKEYTSGLHTIELVRHKGNLCYPLELAGSQIYLQAKVLDKGGLIFVFDPREKEVKEAGANVLAQLIKKHSTRPSLWFTPQSDKSVPMIKKAYEQVNGYGGEGVQDLVRAVYPERLTKDKYAKISKYSSVVTRDVVKELGIKQSQRQLMDSFSEIIVVDDIGSTLETLKAIWMVTERPGSPRPKAFIVARELPVYGISLKEKTLSFAYPETEDNGIFAAATIPLITGDVAWQLAEMIERGW